MNFDCGWKKLWTIHGIARQAGKLISKDSTFWLEPIYSNGRIVYYSLHPENGMHSCLNNLTLYPVGWKDMAHKMLPPWKEDDPPTADQFTTEADRIRIEGRKNPLAKRLEGTFMFENHNSSETLIARIYCFPGGEEGRKDWLVFDVIAETSTVEDGTGHGDA